jgi:SAM-dependent methyltransferase
MMRLRQRLCFIAPAMFLALFGAIGSALAEGDPDVVYVPTPQYVVNEMLEAAGTNKDDVVYDLGCGDGRIVITAAKKFGARGIGIDIDPQRILESQDNAVRAGVADRVKFVEADLFKTDFSQATVVALYLLPELNLRLRPKLFKELKPGARIVSHDFDMADWNPDLSEEIGGDFYFLWILPADVAGRWHLKLSSSAGQDQEYTLQLIQKFQEIGGQAIFKGAEIASSDYKIKGDKLRFFISTSIRGSKVGMYFKGQVKGVGEGASLSGTVQVEGGPFSGSHSWTAVRSK